MSRCGWEPDSVGKGPPGACERAAEQLEEPDEADAGDGASQLSRC